jgi:hypothetical protein
MAATISRQLVADDQRTTVTADLFGAYFPLQLEPFVFSTASRLSADYSGGYWRFFQLSNGGFYMAPEHGTDSGSGNASTGRFEVCSMNGSECFLSADALGITGCLYAYSHLSFGQGEFAETCADQYHLLREYVFAHVEARGILQAID